MNKIRPQTLLLISPPQSHDYFVKFLFSIKIIFMILALCYFFLKEKNKANTKLAENILFWKDRCEFIFIAGISLLILYLFNPRGQPKIIDATTKFLLFVFGILVLIHSNWELFFKESKWIQELQEITGGYYKSKITSHIKLPTNNNPNEVTYFQNSPSSSI
jgi:hypothetical protein